jgi:hypothetical protein
MPCRPRIPQHKATFRSNFARGGLRCDRRLAPGREDEGCTLSGFQELVGELRVGDRSSQLQRTDHGRENRLGSLDVRMRKQRLDMGNHAMELSGKGTPSRL